MNNYQIAWLEQFLRPATHLLTPLWPVIRPLLRLATALTAATVAFQMAAVEGLGIWLALVAGLMSWNFLFKAPPGFTNSVEEIGGAEIEQTIEDAGQDDPVVVSPTYDDYPANNWYGTSRN
jgi:hypothetical protein